MNAGLLEKLPVEVITPFAGLCDRAGDDLTVALEFMPYSGVPDLTTVWQVVRDAGRRNGALIVDVWHWARAGMTPADLVGVPADRIVSVQLCDVLAGRWTSRGPNRSGIGCRPGGVTAMPWASFARFSQWVSGRPSSRSR